MNAIDLLVSQHRETDLLFEKALKADAAQKLLLLEELAELLAVHTAIEEQLFYPTIKSRDTIGILKESVQEHQEAKKLADQLLSQEMEESVHELDGTLEDLVKAVRHHVEEEENELFPKVRQAFDAAKLENLGRRMEQLAMRIMQEEDPAERITLEKDQPARI